VKGKEKPGTEEQPGTVESGAKSQRQEGVWASMEKHVEAHPGDVGYFP
jgi:hypothetical protein